MGTCGRHLHRPLHICIPDLRLTQWKVSTWLNQHGVRQLDPDEHSEASAPQQGGITADYVVFGGLGVWNHQRHWQLWYCIC